MYTEIFGIFSRGIDLFLLKTLIILLAIIMVNTKVSYFYVFFCLILSFLLIFLCLAFSLGYNVNSL